MAADGSITGHAFNFSNEVQLTVLEMTVKILNLLGRGDIEPIILGEAQNEIPHQYLSAEKARNVLGWRSAFSIEDGLARTIDWYRNFLSTIK